MSMHAGYKSLCAAVAICSTLVNIQTHTLTRTHTETALDQLIWPANGCLYFFG